MTIIAELAHSVSRWCATWLQHDYPSRKPTQRVPVIVTTLSPMMDELATCGHSVRRITVQRFAIRARAHLAERCPASPPPAEAIALPVQHCCRGRSSRLTKRRLACPLAGMQAS